MSIAERQAKRKAKEREKKMLIWTIKQEIFRFAVQLVATALFIFVLVPLMENPDTRLWLELGAGFMFTLWLGEKIRTYREEETENEEA